MRPCSKLVLLAILLQGCAASETTGSLTLEVRPDGDRFLLLSRGEVMATVPGRASLDRVSAAGEPNSRRVLAAVHHGEEGGATLQLLEGAEARPLLRTASDESLSTPVWSLAGDGFAVVLQRGARMDEATRRLVHAGELWAGDSDGQLRRLAPEVNDAARALGWIDEGTLLFTRYAGGDLPEESLAELDVRRGAVRSLLGASPGVHLYGFALVGDRVAVVRTDRFLGSGPAPDQLLELLLIDRTGALEMVAQERGAVPIEVALEDEQLRYRLEGTSSQVTIDLETGLRLLDVIPAWPGPPSLGPLLAGLSMPYIHQRYDTPDEFDGSWACGPTSTVMAVQHFGRLNPWPVTVSVPSPHQSDFGAYVSRKYTAHGYTFDRMQTDASGKASWGAYGHCTDGGAGWAWRMQDYAKKHSLNSDFYSTTSFAQVKAAIDAGKVVVLSTNLTSSGHLITVKGYTADGKLIVNDPWGNKTLGTYPNYKGADTVYGFSYVIPKWHITVHGTPTKVEPDYAASVVDKSFPATLVSGATAKATLTFKNSGTAAWDAKTHLGTTMPRDRESPFYSAGWINKNRPAGAGAVKPGANGTVTFTLTAPTVAEKKTFKECFNLVQEGTTWFSAAGGPKDDAICFSIEVLPAPAAVEGQFVAALGGTAEPANPAGPTGPTGPTAPTGPSSGAVGGCSVGPSSSPSLLLFPLLLGLALARRRR